MSGEIHYVPTFDGFTLGNGDTRITYVERPGLFHLKARIEMGST